MECKKIESGRGRDAYLGHVFASKFLQNTNRLTTIDQHVLILERSTIIDHTIYIREDVFIKRTLLS